MKSEPAFVMPKVRRGQRLRNLGLIPELPTRGHWRNDVLDSVQAKSLLTIMSIIGPALLLAVLIYGTIQWSRRRRGPTQAVREESTRRLYREGDKAEKREATVPQSRASEPS